MIEETEHGPSPFPLDGGRVGDGGDPVDGRAPLRPRHAEGAIPRARRLRRQPTVGERLLWADLRKLGLNLRRQAPIGRYVADFVHFESRLVVLGFCQSQQACSGGWQGSEPGRTEIAKGLRKR